MSISNFTIVGLISSFFGKMRFPQLFWLAAIVFVADLFIPDAIPFVDEIFLGLVTLLLGSITKRKTQKKSPPQESSSSED